MREGEREGGEREGVKEGRGKNGDREERSRPRGIISRREESGGGGGGEMVSIGCAGRVLRTCRHRLAACWR